MDPASSIIGFVTTGLTIAKLVRDTLDDINGAPDSINSLHDRAADVIDSFERLQASYHEGILPSPRDMERFGRCARRAERCLREIEVFLQKVLRQGKDGRLRVNKLQWLLKGKTLDDLSTQLDNLEGALNSILLLLMPRFIRQEINFTISARSSYQQNSSTPQNWTSDVIFTCSLAHRLHCDEDCICRCHSNDSRQLVPYWLTSLAGHLHVSTRLLHDLWISSWECNVRSCRRDKTGSVVVRWYLPNWAYFLMPFSDLRADPRGASSLYVSIRSPRPVSRTAPIWSLIRNEQIDDLRALFRSGGASALDVDEDANTVLVYACRVWFFSQSENSYEIIKFLVDAGADPQLAVGRGICAIGALVIMSFGVLLEHPTSSFATQLSTTPLAIHVCKSIFRMNLVDVVQIFFDNRKASRECLQAVGLQPESPGADGAAIDVASLFQRFLGLTPLEYAITFMSSQHIEQQLQHGYERVGAPLAHAANREHHGVPDLVERLIAAGADVNAHNREGWSALHLACYRGNIGFLRQLVRHASGRIDWGARTPDGKSVLRLAQESHWVDGLPALERRQLFMMLSHYLKEDTNVDFCPDERDQSYDMPGSFHCERKQD